MSGSIGEILVPHAAILPGGLEVERALPYRGGRTVGPFVFLDHMRPFLAPREGTVGDVAPHPHIGLSTLTYLFEGAMTHRDSLGSVQRILPGEVNWMTAGRGIVHSERLAAVDRATGMRLHAVQLWVALPKELEEEAPSFEHHEKSTIPTFSLDGVDVALLAGGAFDRRSPVNARSPLFLMNIAIPAGRSLRFDPENAESAFHLMTGRISVNGRAIDAPSTVVFQRGAPIELSALTISAGFLLGGQPFPERRHIWWNYVSSSRELIKRAKEDWREQRMGRIQGETEYLPLP